MNRPAGAKIRDGTCGTSVVGSGSRARIALIQIREASRITMMISSANSAARTPSTVVFVTTAFISSTFCAGARTSPWSSASWKRSRCAKKPIVGSPENTFW